MHAQSLRAEWVQPHLRGQNPASSPRNRPEVVVPHRSSCPSPSSPSRRSRGISCPRHAPGKVGPQEIEGLQVSPPRPGTLCRSICAAPAWAGGRAPALGRRRSILGRRTGNHLHRQPVNAGNTIPCALDCRTGRRSQYLVVKFKLWYEVQAHLSDSWDRQGACRVRKPPAGTIGLRPSGLLQLQSLRHSRQHLV